MTDIELAASEVADVLRPHLVAAAENSERLAALVKAAVKAPAGGRDARAQVAAHYAPHLADAYRKTFPGIVQSARDAAAVYRNRTVKAAVPDSVAIGAAVNRFRQTQQADSGLLAGVLRAINVDAWAAAIFAAISHPQIGTAASGLQIAPDDWQPGWAADTALDGAGLPYELADLVAGADTDASNVAAGLLNRACRALQQGLTDGTPVSSIGASVRDLAGDTDQTDRAADQATAWGFEQGSQAAYKAADVDTWDWVADEDDCDVCSTNASESPHPAGGGPSLPAHPGCKCISQPSEESSP